MPAVSTSKPNSATVEGSAITQAPYLIDCTRWKSKIAMIANSKPETVTAAVKTLAEQANILSGKWVIAQKVGDGGRGGPWMVRNRYHDNTTEPYAGRV